MAVVVRETGIVSKTTNEKMVIDDAITTIKTIVDGVATKETTRIEVDATVTDEPLID